MRQAVAAANRDRRGGEIQDLNLDLVGWAAVVRIDDANSVGDHQATLERRAATGEDAQEMAGRDFDDQPGRDRATSPGATAMSTLAERSKPAEPSVA